MRRMEEGLLTSYFLAHLLLLGSPLTSLLMHCCSCESMSMEIWGVTGNSFSEMQMKVVMVEY